jgi:hypothetical protein
VDGEDSVYILDKEEEKWDILEQMELEELLMNFWLQN